MKNKITLLIIIISLIVFSFGCKSTVKIGNIMGIATLNGTASSGITVTITGTSETTTTDTNGGYSFTGITSGSVVLTFSKTGYSTETTTVVVTGGTTTIAQAVDLSSNYGSITGTARLYGQSVHTGITVTIVESGVETTTDTTGTYQFSNVAAGTVTLVFSKTGYTSTTENSITVQNGTATTVTTVTLQVNSSITTTSITGIIDIVGETDDSGVLVSADGTTLSATTATDGSFTISGISSGTYDLTITKTGCVSTTTTDITVTTGQATDIDTLSFYKQATVDSYYNLSSIISGTIQSMEEMNGYLFIATNTKLYRISTSNPTVIVNSTAETLTHNYFLMAHGAFGDDYSTLQCISTSHYVAGYSEDLTTTINVELVTEDAQIEMFDLLYEYQGFSFTSEMTGIGFNKTSHYFDQYLGGPTGGGGDSDDDEGIFFLLYYSTLSPDNNIKDICNNLLMSNLKYYACSPLNIYKFNYNFSQYDAVRISNSTNLFCLKYSSPYIWALDKNTKILYKITDDLN